MKILLTAINAKYIHSNLAVYSLRANAGKYKEYVELAEFTINQRAEEILRGIYRKKPDVLCFSCYIWNISIVQTVAREIRKLLPETKIWLGGPEVSYDIESGLLKETFVDGIMIGEGEETFRELAGYYIEEKPQQKDGMEERMLSAICGIAFRGEQGKIIITPPRSLMEMGNLAFPYEDLADFEHKIIYYETSRGCPYCCSYCLSSVQNTNFHGGSEPSGEGSTNAHGGNELSGAQSVCDSSAEEPVMPQKKVRLRPQELVERELAFFLDRNVPQVKFIDRTFNCNRKHSRRIWQYLLAHDNGITNFHFEISADLLEEEDFQILNAMRPGLVQLEIGVQSTNEKTIAAIHRRMDLDRLAYAVRRVHDGKNIHQHLDLIAGLPWENLASFQKSFCDVYAMQPDQLQLGFLKVLKGTAMEEDSRRYAIVYQDIPPYEVLKTEWLSYDDVLLLKGMEEMVEVYYNSHQFACSMAFLVHYFDDAFCMYRELAGYYERTGGFDRKHTRLQRFEILKDFFAEEVLKLSGFFRKVQETFPADVLLEVFCELLTTDVYLRENSKTRPDFAPDQTEEKEHFREFYKKEDKERRYLKGYEDFSGKQLMSMTHMEHIRINVEKTAQTGLPVWKEADLLFDYRDREPLHHQARVMLIEREENRTEESWKGR